MCRVEIMRIDSQVTGELNKVANPKNSNYDGVALGAEATLDKELLEEINNSDEPQKETVINVEPVDYAPKI